MAKQGDGGNPEQDIARSSMWGGRFSEPTDEFVARFTASVDVDRRLYRHDIRGSIAHARALHGAGVLTVAERDAIVDGLTTIRAEIERGEFAWDPRADSGLGPSLALSQSVGAEATGGMDSLLSRRTLAGLSVHEEGEELERRRFEARLGYGLAMFGGRYTGTPELGLGVGDSHHELGLGWRLAQRRDSGLAFDLGVKGTRREERDGGSGPAQGLTLDLGWRLVGERYPNSSADLRFEATHRDVANDASGADQGVGVRLSVRW